MSASIDEQFIDYIVKTIVGNPDAVSIKRTIDEKGVLLELTVDQEDLGRVIGKRGAGAQALRTLLRALGTKNDARYNLKIIDVGGERPPRQDRQDQPAREDNKEKPDDQPAENQAADEQVAQAPEQEATLPDTSAENLAEAEEDANDDRVFADDQGADESQSNLEKTRRELADLDDLDI